MVPCMPGVESHFFCSVLGLTADIFQGHPHAYTVISNWQIAANRTRSFKCRQSHFKGYKNSCHNPLALFPQCSCNGAVVWAKQGI